jgi:hypothetical protein
VQKPPCVQVPGPVEQASGGGGQLLTQIGPSVESQIGVAQLGQRWKVAPQTPPEQVPVSQHWPKQIWPGGQEHSWFASQVWPQPPQLAGSAETFMQAPLQQTRPSPQAMLSGPGSCRQVRVAGSQVLTVQGLASPHWSSRWQQLTSVEKRQLPPAQLAVEQVAGLPLQQVPPQQTLPAPQLVSSSTGVATQLPAVHTPTEQSPATGHALPSWAASSMQSPVSLSQAPVRHGWLMEQSFGSPRQVPSVWHLALTTHRLPGSHAPARGLQMPSPLARQVSHGRSQRTLQQTPSVQKPETQSPSPSHISPKPWSGWQVASASQWVLDTQSVSAAHPARQATPAASQTYGTQALVWAVGQEPEPSQAAASVSTPSAQLAGPHPVSAPG